MLKKIVILSFALVLGFGLPLQSGEGAGAIAYIAKEFGLDLVARLLARSLLTQLTNDVVKTINNLGEEKDQPSWVRNWKKFLGEAKGIGENQLRSQVNYVVQKGILCDDFKSPLSLAFQASNVPYIDIGNPEKNAELRQDDLLPYQTRIKCTIPDEVRTAFKENFEKGGGWETWKRMVEPQNNFLGALLMSAEELAVQRSSQQEARTNEVRAGQGFLDVKDICQGVGKNAKCTFLGKTLTPAKILGEGATEWLDSNHKWLVSSDELSEVIVALIEASVNKIANFAGSDDEVIPTTYTQSAPNYLPEAETEQGEMNEYFEQSEQYYNEANEYFNSSTNPTPTP